MSQVDEDNSPMKAQAISIENAIQSKQPDCKALFTGFMKLGLIGFGGVLPLAQRGDR